MRLGIFGGTFDPPHVGHLLAASDARDALGLDRLLFIPARSQPLKDERAQASPAQRLEMTRLMAGSGGPFEVDPIEMERVGLSYTVDTLAAFADRFPDAHRYFLIGGDLVGQLPKWRSPERIASLAELVVLQRVGGDGDGSEHESSPYPMVRIPTRRVDVSSTEIRARVRADKPIRGFVTDAVAEYILSAGLYR
ncbi:MAG: nicotinate-nucleotide adenylyltransferase [Gemmatimonadaceae bacterium]